MEKMNTAAVVVVRPGFLATVQDLGRPGFREFGVTPGGVLDARAARVANLLVGNDKSAALLETTLGGLQLRFNDERLVAWCGSSYTVQVHGIPVPAGRAFLVRPGEELAVEQAWSGCRAWIAISGGIAVPLVLRSRATDLRAAFGGFTGRALRAGDMLPLGMPSPKANALAASLGRARFAGWGAPREWANPAQHSPASVLRVVRGADWTRFGSSAQAFLLGEFFTISPDSDRMGARLDGPAIECCGGGGDLISEAVAPGTIQVPPGGQPILLLADCQTIGGYPKIAHVISVDLSIAAQLAPGDRVCFREISLSEAHQLLIRSERDLARFRVGISLKG
jgi:antagonist of KipI